LLWHQRRSPDHSNELGRGQRNKGNVTREVAKRGDSNMRLGKKGAQDPIPRAQSDGYKFLNKKIRGQSPVRKIWF